MTKIGTQRTVKKDFPGSPVVKNLPCIAGYAGSIPGWGTKIPHAAEQLSQHALLSLRASARESSCVPQ